MDAISQRWEHLYNQTALCDVPFHFANLHNSPFMLQYLRAILSRCPQGGRTLETGIGTGTGAIWLSLRGCRAEGLDYAPGVVERARQVNALLGGSARFRTGDIFDLYQQATGHTPVQALASGALSTSRPYAVIHHQGVLEHFTAPFLQAALAQQVACAERVVFSVPSVYYPFEPEFGDERLLPLAEWERLLAPFDVEELRLYGDPQHGEREHVLCVLRGQDVTDDLLARMTVPAEPYLPGISAIVHTRNESRHIAACLETLQGWTDEIIVCDMESEDDTVEIARRYAAQIVHHPRISNFDRARNVSALRARYAWVFYLDADERVPPGLGTALRALVVDADAEPDFAAVHPPFRHHFAGHWLRCLYPGYTAPRLFKNGHFRFNARLHSGAQVDGPAVLFPGDNPDLALVHHSFDSLSHYLDKLNRYTDGEAANMHRDNMPFHWQHALRHFVQDFQGYYDKGQAGAKDGVHGFLYSFLSAFYRFEQHAKLYELRFRQGQLTPSEQTVPPSVEAMLEYALSVVREQPRPQATPLHIVPRGTPYAAQIVWSGPLLDPSGYGEESRHLLFAMQEAGLDVAAQVLPWNLDAPLTQEERTRIEELAQRPVQEGFVQIIHNFPTLWERHPQAGTCIGRTLFETDRLPSSWVEACNRMEWVCVPTAFNKATFAASGVDTEKLLVVPECFDPAPYARLAPHTSLAADLHALRQAGTTVFLSLFDWTRHKGWDTLLTGFLRAFEGRADVCLVLKVWSTLGYSSMDMQRQAQEYVRQELGVDVLADPRVRWVHERFAQEELIALYQACDAFVLPSRGEGWGRPYMEAMACGLPVIATNWSGNTAFMTHANSYLLDYVLQAVPEAGWKELPTYQGHRWAEPDVKDMIEKLRHIHALPHEARERGQAGQAYVAEHLDYRSVGAALRQMLTFVQSPAHTYLPSILPYADTKVTAHREQSLPPTDAPTSEIASALPDRQDAEEVKVTDRRSSARGKTAKTALAPAAPAAQEPLSPIKPEHSAPTVRWEGDFFQWHSLAYVNRELCLRLLDKGAELALVPSGHTHFLPASQPRFAALVPRAFAPLTRTADVHIRHFFPPRLERPDEGKFVLIQPWEYGFLPTKWLEPIRDNVDEVWCYSRYVKEVYVASGIAPEKLHLLPLGVDAQVFTPDALPHVFTSEPGAGLWRRAQGDRQPGSREEREADGPFVFLFVGGTLERKGIDILLDAYLRAFSAYDDVCLVIKDTGTQTVYRGQNEASRILSLVDDASRPRLVYLDADLSAHRLAGLYAACDCLVQPYRGEGFCLPALEAMACGLPVLVPAGGPTDDFVDEEVGWRLPAARKPLPAPKVGPWDCCGPAWMLEVSPDDLARQMRQVVSRRTEAKRRGQEAHRRAQACTWERSADAMWTRLEALREQPRTEALNSPAPSARIAPAVLVPALVTTAKGKERRRGGKEEAKTPDQGVSPSNQKATANGNGLAPFAARPAPTISLCMIVRDEERVLGDCLASVKPFVDEIILVDTGSKDRTVEIAQEHGAKVFHFPWCDDFSAARNVSLSHAKGDWLFWMDADDTLPPECGRKLHDLAALAEDRITGFLMQVQIPPAPGESGFTVVDHVKLFRNLPGLRFEGRIHEQILEPLYRLGGAVERTNLYVVHSGYDYSPEGQAKKRERDLTILAKDLAERPDHPFVLFNLGMTAHHLKDYAKAIASLERCLAVSKPHESTVRKVYAMLAGSHLERGELERAKQRLEEGLRLFPQDPELLFRAGILYRELGNLPAAEMSYLNLLNARETGHIDSLDVSMTGFKARHNLALIYQDMGRPAEAEAQWTAAVQENPTFTPSWLGLAEVFLMMRRFEDARKVAERIGGWDAGAAQSLHARLDSLAGQASH